MVKYSIVAVSAVLAFSFPALANVDAYKKCMTKTTKEHVKRSLKGDLSGIIKNIRARSECASYLSDKEIKEIYDENKGWFELFEPGGDLDPTRPGFTKKI